MEFDFKTLRESRKAVAQKIAENLLLYGDLEAPNSGYGSHGTQDHIVAMGSANYLRYLAYIQSEPNGSQHFLTETEAAKEGLTIKRGTEPLILERWTVDAAKEYHAFDLPLYPVHHMEGEHKTLTAYMRRDLLRQHQPSRAALAKFFESAGVLQKDAPQDTETLYHAARAYAKQKFPEISTNQACFVHLLMKQNGIQPDYPHEPLLTAEEVKRYIQEAPDLIFSSISRASKEAKQVQQELRFVERQLEQDKDAERAHIADSYEGKPFENLRVIYSDVTYITKSGDGIVSYSYAEGVREFTDKVGKVIQPKPGEGIELCGEDAYRFLSQVNRTDKRFFHQEGEVQATFSVFYDGKELGNKNRYDLGRLEFGNKKTVAEALEYAMSKRYRLFLTDEKALDAHFESIQRYGNNQVKALPQYQSKDAFRKYLETRLQESQTVWNAFTKEEAAFLQHHPEYDKLNKTDAHPYVAICKESDLEEMQKRGLVIETLPKDTLHDFVTFSPGQWETNEVLGAIDSQAPETIDTAKEDPYICLGQQQELAEGLVAFTTKTSPDEDRWLNIDRAEENGFPKRVLYTMPKEDVSRIKDLSAITLQYKSYAISDSLEVENSSLTFRGLKAIQWFRGNVVQDDTAYKEALEKRMYLPGMAPKHELVLSCEGKPIFSMRYQEGRGDLAKAVPHYLPETLPEKYQKACETVKRYRRAVHQRRWPDEQTQASSIENPAPFPTIEESRETLAKDLEHYTREYKAEEPRATAKFYTLYPFADPAVDTPKKAILGTISEMAKDGCTIARIESVLTHISTERTPEALEILESPEGKQAIRKARKVLHLVQDSKGKSASR